MNSPIVQNGLGGIWAFLAGAFAVATFVFWAIVAWRAMRAHERIAACLEQRLPR